MAPIFLVFGGTGTQGGGVVRDLMAEGGYNIRVPTRFFAILDCLCNCSDFWSNSRKPDSDSAKALIAKGVGIVKCDQHVPDDVRRAMKV